MKTKEGPIALAAKVGWILSVLVNYPFLSVNNSV